MKVAKGFRHSMGKTILGSTQVMTYWSGMVSHFYRWRAVPLLIYVLISLVLNVYAFGMVSKILAWLMFHKAGGLYGAFPMLDQLPINERDLVFYGGGIFFALLVFFITISPFGDWLLRVQLGISHLSPTERAAAEPIFHHVYEQVLAENPAFPRTVQLMIDRKDSTVNAYACGRRTVVMTKGFYESGLPAGQKAGVLAHEFGHLLHYDCLYLQLLAAGGVVVQILANVYIFLFGIGQSLGAGAMSTGSRSRDETGLFFEILGLVAAVICGAGRWLLIGFLKSWHWIGRFVINWAGFDNEYQADKQAGHLGYGPDLADFLEAGDPGAGPEGFSLAALMEDCHPPSYERVKRLRAMGRGSPLKPRLNP